MLASHSGMFSMNIRGYCRGDEKEKRMQKHILRFNFLNFLYHVASYVVELSC